MNKPAYYSPTDTPPKSAHYRLTLTPGGLCQYFSAKSRLLAAARRAMAAGHTVKVDSLAVRAPGRPRGSVATHPNGKTCAQQYTRQELMFLGVAARATGRSVEVYIRETALDCAEKFLAALEKPLDTP